MGSSYRKAAAFVACAVAAGGAALAVPATAVAATQTRVATSLHWTAFPLAVTAGHRATLSGRLVDTATKAGVDGEIVRLYGRPVGSKAKMSLLAQTMTRKVGTTTGVAGFVVTPMHDEQYQLVHVQDAAFRSSATSKLDVTARFSVLATLSPTSVPTGTVADVKASVAPSATGVAYLERWTGKTWKVIEMRKLSTSSTATFIVESKHAGTYRLRVVKPASAHNGAGGSGPLMLTVT